MSDYEILPVPTPNVASNGHVPPAQEEPLRPETPRAHAVVISADEVEEREVEWLWKPYVALGKLCLLDGEPGTGKTLWATALAACVSQGYTLPGQDGTLTESPGAPGMTLIVAAEDDISDTLKPRLRRAGADQSRVKII